MVSLAACLSPPVLDSIGKAIHITDIFLHPPLTATLACYGRVVPLMLPFTRTAETVVLIKRFYNTVSIQEAYKKLRGARNFSVCLQKGGRVAEHRAAPSCADTPG